MEVYIGVDVSLELSSVCVVDRAGQVIRETKVASEPDALVDFCCSLSQQIVLIGLEAGPLSQWLFAGLTEAGQKPVLMETRQVKSALQAMPVKTDRRDAHGIAQLLRTGWFRPVHCKSISAQEIRALLSGRKLLLNKLIEIEHGLRGILRGFGLKMGKVSRGRFLERVNELVAGNPMLEEISQAMLQAHSVLQTEVSDLDRRARSLARADGPCRLMMTAPGVGALTALTFRAAVDDPARFRSSKRVGAHFGLTPRKHQSGETDITGSITRAGDAGVRAMLFEAAQVLLTRVQAPSDLKSWGLAVARRRGLKRAIVAVARKLGTVLHRMWSDGAEFRSTVAAPAATT